MYNMQGYLWLPVKGKIKVHGYSMHPLLSKVVMYAKDEC